MNEVDRFRILVRHLISLGIAPNQKELGKCFGYENIPEIITIISYLICIT